MGLRPTGLLHPDTLLVALQSLLLQRHSYQSVSCCTCSSRIVDACASIDATAWQICCGDCHLPALSDMQLTSLVCATAWQPPLTLACSETCLAPTESLPVTVVTSLCILHMLDPRLPHATAWQTCDSSIASAWPFPLHAWHPVTAREILQSSVALTLVHSWEWLYNGRELQQARATAWQFQLRGSYSCLSEMCLTPIEKLVVTVVNSLSVLHMLGFSWHHATAWQTCDNSIASAWPFPLGNCSSIVLTLAHSWEWLCTERVMHQDSATAWQSQLRGDYPCLHHASAWQTCDSGVASAWPLLSSDCGIATAWHFQVSSWCMGTHLLSQQSPCCHKAGFQPLVQLPGMTCHASSVASPRCPLSISFSPQTSSGGVMAFASSINTFSCRHPPRPPVTLQKHIKRVQLHSPSDNRRDHCWLGMHLSDGVLLASALAPMGGVMAFAPDTESHSCRHPPSNQYVIGCYSGQSFIYPGALLLLYRHVFGNAVALLPRCVQQHGSHYGLSSCLGSLSLPDIQHREIPPHIQHMRRCILYGLHLRAFAVAAWLPFIHQHVCYYVHPCASGLSQSDYALEKASGVSGHSRSSSNLRLHPIALEACLPTTHQHVSSYDHTGGFCPQQHVSYYRIPNSYRYALQIALSPSGPGSGRGGNLSCLRLDFLAVEAWLPITHQHVSFWDHTSSFSPRQHVSYYEIPNFYMYASHIALGPSGPASRQPLSSVVEAWPQSHVGSLLPQAQSRLHLECLGLVQQQRLALVIAQGHNCSLQLY